MVLDRDDRRVAALYAALLRTHGPTFKALDWSAQSSQDQRFEALTKLGIASGDRVLDVGCGLGDFLPWLVGRGVRITYTGIDITPDFVAHCRATHGEGCFLEGNVLEDLAGLAPRSFDWVVASGIFAHRQDRPWDYMKALIAAMMALADRGVAFNAQSTLAPHPERWKLFHADPHRTETHCRDSGWTCLLVHDPGKTDFTQYMWRPESDAGRGDGKPSSSLRPA
ncbi:MAG: class I SAM-dependent methyltransferase [Rhodospirillum sp.]|nr:class I SAM-dependent methyltransferase [Rhodospirillum sp.]MCF8489267.1 class I SAM-dependent methyltransferase [Rhodospirillum sp.]MCF8502726.1 class I SAM-dependent methyltransferase [Rhodospirillum sp.]